MLDMRVMDKSHRQPAGPDDARCCKADAAIGFGIVTDGGVEGV